MIAAIIYHRFMANKGNLADVIKDDRTNPYSLEMIQSGSKKQNKLTFIETAAEVYTKITKKFCYILYIINSYQKYLLC